MKAFIEKDLVAFLVLKGMKCFLLFNQRSMSQKKAPVNKAPFQMFLTD